MKQKQIFFIVRHGTYFTTRKLSIGLRKSASVLNDNLRRNMANHGNPRLTCCVYVMCIWLYMCILNLYGSVWWYSKPQHILECWNLWELTLTPYSAQFTGEILSEITENGWTWTKSLTPHHPDDPRAQSMKGWLWRICWWLIPCFGADHMDVHSNCCINDHARQYIRCIWAIRTTKDVWSAYATYAIHHI